MAVLNGYPGVVTNQPPSTTPWPTPTVPPACVGHRPINASSSPNVTAITPGAGTRIDAAKINELRAAIATEINTWQQHSHYTGVTTNSFYSNILGISMAPGVVITPNAVPGYQSSVEDPDTAMQYVQGAGQPGTTVEGNSSPYPPGGTTPLGADVNSTSPTGALGDLTFSNYIKASDYNALLAAYNALKADCICNSDCNCNAVCACHGNCGCNYSDMRLKKEIQYC